MGDDAGSAGVLALGGGVVEAVGGVRAVVGCTVRDGAGLTDVEVVVAGDGRSTGAGGPGVGVEQDDSRTAPVSADRNLLDRNGVGRTGLGRSGRRISPARRPAASACPWDAGLMSEITGPDDHVDADDQVPVVDAVVAAEDLGVKPDQRVLTFAAAGREDPVQGVAALPADGQHGVGHQ